MPNVQMYKQDEAHDRQVVQRAHAFAGIWLEQSTFRNKWDEILVPACASEQN